MTTTAISEPKLAPPGAGLPAMELVAARIIFRVRVWRGNRDSFTALFERERGRIRELTRDLNEEDAGRRVLIRRPIGIEDSSRNWSVWMTLEHLRIVNDGITGILRSLTNGRVPPGQASTAAVKPGATVDGSVVEVYEASCDALLAEGAGSRELETAVRFAHPWFGALNAREWYAMAGMHMGIHRVQLERIVAGLRG